MNPNFQRNASTALKALASSGIALSLALYGLVGCGVKQPTPTNEPQVEAPEIESNDKTGVTYTDDDAYRHPPITGLVTDLSFDNHHAPATETLISMVEHSPELKALLEKSIAKAAEVNPDRTTNPAQTLEEYYDFVDWADTALPWQIAPWADQYSTLYDRIDQSLNYFYFLVDQPLEELEDLGYYNNTLQYHEPFRSWLILFTETYGQFLNTTDSWSDEYYQTALANPDFQLDGDLYEDPSNWKTFNQFFARYLSDPSVRPIAEPDNPAVVVSPADTQPQGVWEIDEESMVVSDDPITIKSGTLRSVATLLGPSKYANEFAGGTFTHMFLDVNDYHRYHFPVSGTIKEVLVMPGDDAIGGRVVWDPTTQLYKLQASDTSWQSIETRGLVIVETDGYGLVAVMPVGMSQVSSVTFEDTVQEGQRVEKGDMLGCFLFGGSDIVLLFQGGIDFQMDCPRYVDGGYEHIEMGSRFATLSVAE
ncbi:MAG: phosphatidylserine decarboxylase [Coriobacteriales bacterium]|nr:phosphatidylserine decarboxylase [Coriobacteriales bacterium]